MDDTPPSFHVKELEEIYAKLADQRTAHERDNRDNYLTAREIIRTLQETRKINVETKLPKFANHPFLVTHLPSFVSQVQTYLDDLCNESNSLDDKIKEVEGVLKQVALLCGKTFVANWVLSPAATLKYPDEEEEEVPKPLTLPSSETVVLSSSVAQAEKETTTAVVVTPPPLPPPPQPLPPPSPVLEVPPKVAAPQQLEETEVPPLVVNAVHDVASPFPKTTNNVEPIVCSAPPSATGSPFHFDMNDDDDDGKEKGPLDSFNGILFSGGSGNYHSTSTTTTTTAIVASNKQQFSSPNSLKPSGTISSFDDCTKQAIEAAGDNHSTSSFDLFDSLKTQHEHQELEYNEEEGEEEEEEEELEGYIPVGDVNTFLHALPPLDETPEPTLKGYLKIQPNQPPPQKKTRARKPSGTGKPAKRIKEVSSTSSAAAAAVAPPSSTSRAYFPSLRSSNAAEQVFQKVADTWTLPNKEALLSFIRVYIKSKHFAIDAGDELNLMKQRYKKYAEWLGVSDTGDYIVDNKKKKTCVGVDKTPHCLDGKTANEILRMFLND